MTFITAHWALILSILAIVHVTVSSILGLINKPEAETVFEQVWHYVQIAAGLGTKLAASKDSTVTDAVSELTGEAADLANGKYCSRPFSSSSPDSSRSFSRSSTSTTSRRTSSKAGLRSSGGC